MAEHYYYSIASGSSGNCGLYMADGTAILIDLGVAAQDYDCAEGTVAHAGGYFGGGADA